MCCLLVTSVCLCVFCLFVFVLILLQLRLDRSAVDKESRFPPCRTGSKHQIVWTGFGSSSLRTEQVLNGQNGCSLSGQNRLQTDGRRSCFLLGHGRMWQQLLPWLTFRPWCGRVAPNGRPGQSHNKLRTRQLRARHGAPAPALHMPRPRTGTDPLLPPSDRHWRRHGKTCCLFCLFLVATLCVFIFDPN